MSVEFDNKTHALAWVLILFSFLVAGLGSFISSAEYGQAIPDWPLANGRLIPENLVGGIFWEYLHRLAAGVAALVGIVAGFWLWSRHRSGTLGRVGLAAALLVAVQTLLGGMGVVTEFPLWVEVLHVTLAAAVLAVAVIWATLTSSGWLKGDGFDSTPSAKMVRGTRGLAIMVMLQTVVGAVTRHAEVQVLFLGSLLLHLLLALGVTMAGATTSIPLFKRSRGPVAVAALTVVVVVLVQLVLGMMVLVSAPAYDDESGPRSVAYIFQSVTHVLAGLLLLATTVYLMLVTRRRLELDADNAPVEASATTT